MDGIDCEKRNYERVRFMDTYVNKLMYTYFNELILDRKGGLICESVTKQVVT